MSAVARKYDQRRRQQAVLDPGRALLEPRRHLDPQPGRDHPVHQLGEGPEGADAPAVEPPPQHRGHDRERREQVPGEAVAEDRHVPGHQSVDVDHRDELALGEPHVGDGGDESDVLEGDALLEEPHEDQRREAGEEPDIDGLVAEQGAPGLRLRLVVGKAPGVVTLLVVLEVPSVVFLLVVPRSPIRRLPPRSPTRHRPSGRRRRPLRGAPAPGRPRVPAAPPRGPQARG